MNLFAKLFVSLALPALLMAPLASRAAPFDIYAQANSSTGGAGLDTISLGIGDWFSVSVDPGDLWNAGALPRWSNANGLTGDLYATGSDDSGYALGTLIGKNFGLWTQGNLTAPYGALVGSIGGGDFFVIGTSFTGQAATSGMLQLFYWDSVNSDNTQYVTADVLPVPEPGSWVLLLAGLGMLGFIARRRI